MRTNSATNHFTSFFCDHFIDTILRISFISMQSPIHVKLHQPHFSASNFSQKVKNSATNHSYETTSVDPSNRTRTPSTIISTRPEE